MAWRASWGGVALDTGQAAHFAEHRVDHPGVKPAVAVGVGGARKKQHRRLPFLKISGSFFCYIIFDRGYSLPRNLVPVLAAALLFDIDQTPFKVHIRKIDVSDRRQAYAGFDQSVNDGPVAKGPLLAPKTVAVFDSLGVCKGRSSRPLSLIIKSRNSAKSLF